MGMLMLFVIEANMARHLAVVEKGLTEMDSPVRQTSRNHLTEAVVYLPAETLQAMEVKLIAELVMPSRLLNPRKLKLLKIPKDRKNHRFPTKAHRFLTRNLKFLTRNLKFLTRNLKFRTKNHRCRIKKSRSQISTPKFRIRKHKSLINHHRSRTKMNKGLRNHKFPTKFLKFPIRLSRSQINLHKNLKALSPQVPKSLCPLLIKFRMRQNFMNQQNFQLCIIINIQI